MTPDDQTSLLIGNLPTVADDVASGAIVVIARGRLRVRLLPVHGTD